MTNNYITTPTSPNSYITRKLNNMDEAKEFKKERDDWTRLYHKTMKGLETIIDVQEKIQDIMKIAGEMNTMIMEMEERILKTSINNRMTNATNILEILEDLRYLIQSNMKDWVYQIQKRLADELDTYSERGNQYVDDNIKEVQKLYKDIEWKKSSEGRVEDKEVILIKLYKVFSSSSTMKSSFINDEVDNLIKYMKFIWSFTQTRIFRPPPYYQLLKSRGEQNPEFWEEIATALVKNKYNTKTS